MIEKLKTVDGTLYPYLDEDGVSWENKSSYLKIKILHLCGCGNSDEVMIYIRDMLKRFEGEDPKFGGYDDLPFMFFTYWANHNNFLEHGSTVRCSWLTDKGEELLRDIEQILKEESEGNK